MATASNELKIDDLTLRKGALVLRAVNHKLRQQLLREIHRKGSVSVTDLYVKLRLEQSVASQHLAILRHAGFVTTERNGQQILYSVNYKRLDDVQVVANKLIPKFAKNSMAKPG